MKKWTFLSNPFDLKTKDSYKKMLTLIVRHTNVLGASSDPFIRKLYLEPEPVSTAYSTAYATWTSSKGGRAGESLRVRQLLKVLYTGKIPKWEVDVLVRFHEKSPEYKTLFKGGRTAFRRGPYNLRAEKLASLAMNLEAFPGLFATRLEVEDFHKQLTKALNTNKGESFGVKGASTSLEAARKAAAVRMYANLGYLMGHFAEDPKQIKRFFETNKLRRRKPKRKPKADVKKLNATKIVTPQVSVPVVPVGYDEVRLFRMAR
jgi:hypothetical protein